MLQQILPHVLWPKGENVRVARVDTRLEPMHVGISERLDAREILDAPLAARAEQRLVDTEVMAVAVDEHDRLAERKGLALQHLEHLIEAPPDPVRGSNFEMRVGLHDEHHRAELFAAGQGEGLLNPGDVRRVARAEFRRAEMIVVARHVQPREHDAAIDPTDVLTELRERRSLTLTKQR